MTNAFPELDLRVHVALSEAGKYWINAKTVFPKTPLRGPESGLTPINIFFTLVQTADEDDLAAASSPMGHYILCLNLESLMGPKRFCPLCAGIVPAEGSPEEAWHPCPIRCTLCDGYCSTTRRNGSVAMKIFCPACQLYFRSERCFNLHKKNTICCKKRLRCPKCEKVIKAKKGQHNHCGEIHCITCREWYPKEESADHKCFISNDIGEADVLQKGEHKTFLDFGNDYILLFTIPIINWYLQRHSHTLRQGSKYQILGSHSASV